MTDSKVHIGVLVEETIALTRSISVQSPPPPPVEPASMPTVNLRDELRERVSNFKAHQERLAREREDYAASQIKRMRERVITQPHWGKRKLKRNRWPIAKSLLS
jgi:hypothetical protein